MLKKQQNTKFQKETLDELQDIADHLSIITEEHIEISKVIRYFIHKGIEQKKEFLNDINVVKNFKSIVELLDAKQTLKK